MFFGDIIIYTVFGGRTFMAINSSIISNIIKCPVCAESVYVSEDAKSLFCRGARRHCFDFSADGYINLSRQGTGDSKEAINARKLFLSGDYYLPIAEEIREVVKKYVPTDATVIDAGCGEGYYTNKLAEQSGAVLGFDLSKFGVAAAAKSAKRQELTNTFYSTGSVFELPVKDSSVDCVVNIFAPCAEDEYMRVLKDGGVLVVVGAGKNHLMGLKKVLYDTTYENSERADLPVNITPIEHLSESFDIEVCGREAIDSLFSMTPYYWRTSEADKDKLKKIDTLKTEVEFEIYVYKK